MGQGQAIVQESIQECQRETLNRMERLATQDAMQATHAELEATHRNVVDELESLKSQYEILQERQQQLTQGIEAAELQDNFKLLYQRLRTVRTRELKIERSLVKLNKVHDNGTKQRDSEAAVNAETLSSMQSDFTELRNTLARENEERKQNFSTLSRRLQITKFQELKDMLARLENIHEGTAKQWESDVLYSATTLRRIKDIINSDVDTLRKKLAGEQDLVRKLRQEISDYTQRENVVHEKIDRLRDLCDMSEDKGVNDIIDQIEKKLKDAVAQGEDFQRKQQLGLKPEVFKFVAKKIDARDVARHLYEKHAIDEGTMERVNLTYKDCPITAAGILLNILQSERPEYFHCFKEIIKLKNPEAYKCMMLNDVDPAEESSLIRYNYVYLVNTLDARDSDGLLLDELYQRNLISVEDKQDIESEPFQNRQNERLLTVIDRGSKKDICTFFTVLPKVGQGHIVEEIFKENKVSEINAEDEENDTQNKLIAESDNSKFILTSSETENELYKLRTELEESKVELRQSRQLESQLRTKANDLKEQLKQLGTEVAKLQTKLRISNEDFQTICSLENLQLESKDLLCTIVEMKFEIKSGSTVNKHHTLNELRSNTNAIICGIDELCNKGTALLQQCRNAHKACENTDAYNQSKEKMLTIENVVREVPVNELQKAMKTAKGEFDNENSTKGARRSKQSDVVKNIIQAEERDDKLQEEIKKIEENIHALKEEIKKSEKRLKEFLKEQKNSQDRTKACEDAKLLANPSLVENAQKDMHDIESEITKRKQIVEKGPTQESIFPAITDLETKISQLDTAWDDETEVADDRAERVNTLKKTRRDLYRSELKLKDAAQEAQSLLDSLVDDLDQLGQTQKHLSEALSQVEGMRNSLEQNGLPNGETVLQKKFQQRVISEGDLQKSIQEAIEKHKQQQVDLRSIRKDERKLLKHLNVCLSSAVIAHHQSANTEICGIASAETHVYVLNKHESEHVAVYDVTKSYRLVRYIHIPGLAEDYHNNIGLAFSSIHECILVSDFDGKCVHTLDLNNAAVAQRLTLDCAPNSMSVTQSNNILILSAAERRLYEYDMQGLVLQHVTLSPDIVYPHHAIQLPGGEHLLCHGDMPSNLCRVLKIGAEAKQLKTFGEGCGYYFGKLDTPRSMVADQNGNVYVADTQNDRIVMLDSSLELKSYVMQGINKPHCLCLDQTGKLLFIGGFDKNVTVIELDGDDLSD